MQKLTSSLSGLQVIGMTSHGALSKETYSIPYTVCTVLFFERSSFEVDVFDCHMQMPREAGKEYKCVLHGYEAPKAILMMSSDFSLCPEPFIDCVNELDCNLVVFGALAGTRRMGDDKLLVFVGNRVYDRAVVVVAFAERRSKKFMEKKKKTFKEWCEEHKKGLIVAGSVAGVTVIGIASYYLFGDKSVDLSSVNKTLPLDAKDKKGVESVKTIPANATDCVLNPIKDVVTSITFDN